MGKHKKRLQKKRLAQELAKRSPTNDGHNSAADPFTWPELRAAVDEKRGRRAIAIANHLVAHSQPSDDQLPLIVAAYELRLRELIKDGHAAEAVGLYQNSLHRHPHWQAHFSLDCRLLIECYGGPVFLLTQYGTAMADESLTAGLRRILDDPILIGSHPAIPPEHPLRIEAQLIVDAWNAIESGGDEAAIHRLAAISRRSPFCYWRLFLQALNSFYRGKDALVQENLSRIPADAAAHSAAALLTALMQRQRPPTTAAGALYDRVYAFDFRSRLLALDKLLDADKRRGGVEETGAICRALTAAGQHLMACDLLVSVLVRLYSPESHDVWPDPRLEATVRDPEWVELRARHHLGLADEAAWLRRLADQRRSFSALDVALVYRELAAQRLANAQNRLGFMSPRQSPTTRRNAANAHFKKSIDSLPLPATFRLWHARFAENKWRTKPILDEWHRRFPDDQEALFLLLAEARRTKAATKARGYFHKLEALVKSSPKLSVQKPFIALEHAMEKAKRATSAELDEILNELPREPEIVAIGRDCIEWLYQTESAKRDEAGARLIAYRKPYLVMFCLNRIRASDNVLAGLPPPVKAQFSDPDAAVEGLLDSFQLADDVWRAAAPPWCALMDKALSHKKLSGPIIAGLLRAMYRQCPSFSQNHIMAIGMRVTANALQHQKLPVADLLCFRALIYHAVKERPYSPFQSWTYRAQELLSAARYCLREAGADARLHREIDHFISHDEDNADGREWNPTLIRDLTRREAKIKDVKTVTRPALKPSRWQPPRSKPRRSPRIFDEFDPDELNEGRAIWNSILEEMGGDALDDIDERDIEKQLFDLLTGRRRAPPGPRSTANRRQPINPFNQPEFPDFFF